MEEINHNELEHSLFWGASGSRASRSSFSKNLNLNINSSTLCSHQIQQFGHQLQDQESSSTQSTGQSQEAGSLSASNAQFQFISSGTGYDGSDAKRAGSDIKSVLSLGTPELMCSSLKTGSSQSVGVPFSYSDSHLSGMFAAHGQHSIIHPQMASRVPLPLEVTEDGPIYVNAKQFHAILRRRQLRAKLEARNKASKGRKPYLHESRHLHAMKRIRGSDGRFLNTKLLQLQKEQHQQSKSDARSISHFSPSDLNGRDDLSGSIHLHLKHNSNISTSGASSALQATAISNTNGTFHLPDHRRYADFHGHIGGTMQSGVGMLYNGTQQQVSVIR